MKKLGLLLLAVVIGLAGCSSWSSTGPDEVSADEGFVASLESIMMDDYVGAALYKSRCLASDASCRFYIAGGTFFVNLANAPIHTHLNITEKTSPTTYATGNASHEGTSGAPPFLIVGLDVDFRNTPLRNKRDPLGPPLVVNGVVKIVGGLKNESFAYNGVASNVVIDGKPYSFDVLYHHDASTKKRKCVGTVNGARFEFEDTQEVLTLN